jgi:hypothetical protein
MQSGGQSVRPIVSHPARNFFIAIIVLVAAAAMPATAQVYMHPSTTTQVGGHFLAPPPSVTSVASRHLPPPAPSVTSIPNFGRAGGNGFHNGNAGRFNNGFVGGWAYSIPYYYPVDNSAYGYDYVGAGGPDLYSGPPPGPYDPSLHIVAEQPPANPKGLEGPPEQQAYVAPPAPKPLPDDKPGDPTELVFRNGHHEEVNSYAIMGDAIYVFDQGRKKIALTELDVPATVKANDDRGVQFRLPTPDKKAVTSTPSVAPNSAPQPDSTPSNSANPPNVAAMMP